MWRRVTQLVTYVQAWCLCAVGMLFDIISVSVGAAPFRESPPDAPSKLSFRLLQMIRSSPQRNRKILVLDLDETLVHASTTPLDPTHFDVLVQNPSGGYTTMFVCERPYLQYFLAHVSQWYTVAIFTAATKEYATPIIQKLDRGKVIRKKYFRNDCIVESGHYVKNLSRLSGPRPDLFSNYIIIDNLPASYRSNPHNAIPISSYSADAASTDTELLKLLPLLEALQHVNDVRSVLELRTNPDRRSSMNR